MSRDAQKKLAAEKALEYVEEGTVVGVGTGSTVAFFIDGLARMKGRIEGAVSSSDHAASFIGPSERMATTSSASACDGHAVSMKWSWMSTSSWPRRRMPKLRSTPRPARPTCW